MILFDFIYDWPNKKGMSSIANADCDFLRDMCLQYKPTKIIEFGTGSGKSTWAMALTSNCEIHTIDKEDWYSNTHTNDQIIRYNTHSSLWFDNYTTSDFDFVFIDAFLPASDLAKLLKRLSNNCSIIVHDYYQTDVNSKYPDKGYRNIKSLLMYIYSGDQMYNFNYNLTIGGECCAHLRLER